MQVCNFNLISAFIYVRRDYAELQLNATNMETSIESNVPTQDTAMPRNYL